MNDLVIDARCLASGIGTYGFHLLSRLAETNLRDRTRVVISPAVEFRLRTLFDQITVSNIPIYSLREQFSLPWYASRGTVLHALHYNAPVLHRGPLLVSIHDLTHILDDNYRNDWRSWIYARPMLLAAAHRADHIFTGTEYVKQCIVEHLKVPESKITISSYGVGDEFFPADEVQAMQAVLHVTGSGSPFVLFVGNLKPHKNVDNLLRAFAQLTCDLNVHHRLIIVGDDQWGRTSTLLLIHELGLESRVHLITTLTQPELVEFYRAADLVVLPSFQEGFGLPVAEAMACGTPVACSRAASLPEVGGDAVEYFDPRDPESIAATISQVLFSDDNRRQMSKRGIERAKKFTWDRTFRAHLDIYRAFLPRFSAVASFAG